MSRDWVCRWPNLFCWFSEAGVGAVFVGRGIRVSRGDSGCFCDDALKLELLRMYFGLEYSGCRELGLVLASVSDVMFSLDSGLLVLFFDGRRLPKGWVGFLPPRLLPLLIPLGFAVRTPAVFGELRSMISGSDDATRMRVKQISAWWIE